MLNGLLKKSNLILLFITGLTSLNVQAISCQKDLFTGKFIYVDSKNVVTPNNDGTIPNDTWPTFDLFEGERPAGGDYDQHKDLGMLKNKPLVLTQIGCTILKINYHTFPSIYRAPRYLSDMFTSTVNIKITALELKDMGFSEENFGMEKVNWTDKSVRFESGKMGSTFTWRRYDVTIEKLSNGDIKVSRKVSGMAPIPLPIPAYWNSSFILKKM